MDCSCATTHTQQWLPLGDMLIGKLIGRTSGQIFCRIECKQCLLLLLCLHWQCVGHGLADALQEMHSTAQHSTAQHSTAQHSTAQHSTAQHSTAQHSTARVKACLAGFIYHDMRELQGPQTRGTVRRCPFTSSLVEGTVFSFPQHACNTRMMTSHNSQKVHFDKFWCFGAQQMWLCLSAVC